ncbi:hypothetical protein ACGABU_000103 [Morganella morganii]
MSITTTIHQLICLSENYNENAQNTGNVTFTEAFEELPELSEKIRHVENVLNSLPDHNIIVALNLMYVGAEINEDETFRACYDRVKSGLEQTRQKATSKLIEKIPNLANYLPIALHAAKDDEVDINTL